MTDYRSAALTVAEADEITTDAARKAKRKRRIWALGAPLGVLAVGGAAYAAVALFGFGSINAQAATMKNLDVSNARLSGSLVPGKSVGGVSDVGNQNDFDVKVTGIIVQDSSLAVTGSGCDAGSLTLNGSATTYPGSGGGSGHQINLAAPITIQAGQGATITAPNVVSQSSSATALCGVKANFAVVAAVGN